VWAEDVELMAITLRTDRSMCVLLKTVIMSFDMFWSKIIILLIAGYIISTGQISAQISA